jgi:putative membrane protein
VRFNCLSRQRTASFFRPSKRVGDALNELTAPQPAPLDAFLLLRRRGRSDHAGWSRAALFVLAVALGTLPLVSPLDEAGDSYLLFAHMLQHVLIGDVVPALALVALRGPLVFFFPPSAVLRRVAHRARVRRLIVFVLRPRVSLALWAAVIGAWHVPAAYDYALAHPIAHDVEHLSFVAVGLLAWTQIIDPGRRKTLEPAQRLVCASAMLLFTLALGGLLFFAGPLYSTYVRQGTRLFALSPAADQRLAGLVMIGEQLLAFAVCAGFLLPALGRARSLARQAEAPPAVTGTGTSPALVLTSTAMGGD